MKKIILRSSIFLVGITVLSSINSVINSVSATTTSINRVAITVNSSCTMRSSGNDSHTAEVGNGVYRADIGTTTITALCNDAAGFSIYATGYTGDEIGGTNSTKLVGNSLGGLIDTGTATGTNASDPSNWAMKLGIVSDPAPAYPIIIAGSAADTEKQSGDPDFSNYTAVPANYTKVAYRSSSTDIGATATGASLTTTYAAYINPGQVADTYNGKVIYTLVHPAAEAPAEAQACASGKICYFPNTTTAEGVMGYQDASDGNTVKLFASNFSRTGYGFAGWSDAYDYETNPTAHFYGPNEALTVPTGTTLSGLSLYAVWIKSAGIIQDWHGCSSLTAATYTGNSEDQTEWSITANLSSLTALTDERDGQTYAVARLSDNNCWTIENLRLDSTAKLTIYNSNNPLNDGANVALKHNYADSQSFDTLSTSSSVEYDETTAPEGWCQENTPACNNQSRLRNSNTANRIVYANNEIMTSHNVALYSYGNYYNWYSATAGNGTYSLSSGTATGDICPHGWHLPTGSGSGEYGILSNSLGGYQIEGVAQTMSASTSPTQNIIQQRLRHFPNNFIYAGGVFGASADGRGSGGRYWTASASSNNQAYSLGFSSSYTYPGKYSFSKHNGRSVRCLINP